jgi:heme A synthase
VVGLLFAGIVFLGWVLWLLLERHERRRANNRKTRHSGFRLALAAGALLAMLTIGVLSLLLLMSVPGNPSAHAAAAVLIICAPLFLVALLVWWVAMRRESR